MNFTTCMAIKIFEFKSEWIIDSVKDSVESINNAIVNAMRILTLNPAENEVMWGYVDATKSVCMAFAISLIGLFWFVNFLASTINLEMNRISVEFVAKHLFRLLFAKAVVQYAPDFCVYIFNICANFISNLGVATLNFEGIDYSELKRSLDEQGFVEKFVQFIQLWIPGLIMKITGIILNVICYGRIIQICLYTIISPIPLSTLAGESHYSIAKGFIREYANTVLQGAIIILSFGLYKGCLGWFFNPTITNNNSVWELATATLILLFLIIKSGSYVKAFFSR